MKAGDRVRVKETEETGMVVYAGDNGIYSYAWADVLHDQGDLFRVAQDNARCYPQDMLELLYTATGRVDKSDNKDG